MYRTKSIKSFKRLPIARCIRFLANHLTSICAGHTQAPGQSPRFVERRARKVYDPRGRHWQTVAFLRRVAPEAVREAARRRPDLPCFVLAEAARGGARRRPRG